ncbi:hypothetical protein [Tessaracoccus coleopterorum]|uniref:hypothetical protein n=1 Tax=Tessaracoccus coleopterorum TaxID=2714950 RepID=UPI001E4EE758|nr:hypothetical protein [Tessaracoccus coleopterorum]
MQRVLDGVALAEELGFQASRSGRPDSWRRRAMAPAVPTGTVDLPATSAGPSAGRRG